MRILIKIAAVFLLFTTLSVSADDPDINIKGLSSELHDNVLAFLSIAQEDCQSPNWRINKLFDKSDSEINKALRALGYYQPTISKQLTFKDNCWQANFDIQAGKPVRVSQLTIQIKGEAEKDPVFQKLLANLPIKKGDILNHALYEKIKQNLQSLALETGYLKNRIVKKSLQVNPETAKASIEIIMDSGVQHHFGDITIDQDILTPSFIQRYISFKPSDKYSTDRLAKTYNALADSVYFSGVEIKPQIDKTENSSVPVNIHLTPEKRHDYSIGLGYDTDIGPLGSIGYKNRRLNQQGHHASLDLDISPVRSSVEASYMIPFSEPRYDYVSLGLGYRDEKPDTFRSQTAKFSLQYLHLFQTGWKQILFFDVIRETFSIDDESQQTTFLLVTGVRWQTTKSNHPRRPTQGYSFDLSLASAPEAIISDVSFLQATTTAKLITSLPWYARLITRTQLGITLTDDFDRLPASYRFYAGGIETIRGYGYKKLGPTNDKGHVIGGRVLSVASIEYEQFITDSWGIAAFVDAGNAYNSNDFTVKIGTGVGIRWVSPIGPIRLDFAVPLNDSDASFQVHFAAGVQL